MLYYTILYYTILYYTIIYYTILYYTMLCYTILHTTYYILHTTYYILHTTYYIRPIFVLRISFQEVWLSQILIFKGWKASVSRESPGKFAPRILSRKILSIKIARRLCLEAGPLALGGKSSRRSRSGSCQRVSYTIRILYSTLHYTLHTVHYTLCTIHYALYTIPYALHRFTWAASCLAKTPRL